MLDGKTQNSLSQRAASYPTKRNSGAPEGCLSEEPYVYADTVIVGGNSTAQLIFTIDGSFDYDLFKFSYKSTGSFKIQIANQQKLLFKNPVSNSMFAGLEGSTARGLALWHTFKRPYRVFRNSTLTINLTDTSGSSNSVEIALDGVKYIMTV